MKLSDIFEYDAAEGCLRWKAKISAKVSIGAKAGSIRSDGYQCISYYGHRTYAHRVIWELHNGPIPIGMHVDHIDENPRNNRIENLRLLTHSANLSRKSTPQTNNSSGYRGVTRSASGKWMATHRRKYLGSYDTAADAARAYAKAVNEYMYETLTSPGGV